MITEAQEPYKTFRESCDKKLSEREKRREEDCTYTYIRIHTKKTFPNHFTFYIPTALLEPFKKGLEAFEIHGNSASQKICEFVVRYGEMHGRGNPQLLMETFVDPSAPGPMKVVCSQIRGARSDGHILCEEPLPSGLLWKQGYRCYSCKKNQWRKEP